MSKIKYQPNNNSILAIDPKAIGGEFESSVSDEVKIDKNGIAIIEINGPLEGHYSDYFDSYESIENRIRMASKNSGVRAIILKIDSPGGEAAKSVECHRTIKRIRNTYKKPIYAYVDEMACSAAYAIASACDEIWLPETGTVGSIGVIATLLDRTKANEEAGINVVLITTGSHKADGNPDRPLDEAVISTMQKRVDYLGNVFFNVVSKARGISVDDIKKLQAGIFQGEEAVKKNLADGVDSFAKFYQYINMNKMEIEDLSLEDSNNEKNSDKSNKENALHKRNIFMKSILSQNKDIKALEEALISASSDEEKKKLLEQIKKASMELEKAKAKLEEDEESEEDSEDSEEDEEEKSEDDSDDSEDDKDEDDDEKSETDLEENEEEKALFNAKSGLYTAHRLLRYVKQLTGQKELRSAFGALNSMIENKKKEPELLARIAKLEKENTRNKVEAMIRKAKKEGKVAPAQVESLTTQGIKDIKWLKGYLAAAPKLVNTVEESDLSFNANVSSNGSIISTLTKDQLKIVSSVAQVSGRSVEEVAKELLGKVNSTSKKF